MSKFLPKIVSIKVVINIVNLLFKLISNIVSLCKSVFSCSVCNVESFAWGKGSKYLDSLEINEENVFSCTRSHKLSPSVDKTGFCSA